MKVTQLFRDQLGLWFQLVNSGQKKIKSEYPGFNSHFSIPKNSIFVFQKPLR
jgi:hypothetical protein